MKNKCIFVLLCPLEQLAAQLGDEQYLCMVESFFQPCQTAAGQQAGGCEHTLGLCWLWFHVAPDSPNSILCPPTHTHWVPGTVQAQGAITSSYWAAQPCTWERLNSSDILEICSLTFCPDQLPSSLACTTGGVILKEQHIPG